MSYYFMKVNRNYTISYENVEKLKDVVNASELIDSLLSNYFKEPEKVVDVVEDAFKKLEDEAEYEEFRAKQTKEREDRIQLSKDYEQYLIDNNKDFQTYTFENYKEEHAK